MSDSQYRQQADEFLPHGAKHLTPQLAALLEATAREGVDRHAAEQLKIRQAQAKMTVYPETHKPTIGFAPGMKIGPRPEYGRLQPKTLKWLRDNFGTHEVWLVEEDAWAWSFYPDDLSRVIEEKPVAHMRSPHIVNEPSQRKPGQMLIAPNGRVYRLVAVTGGDATYQKWLGEKWSETSAYPIHFSVDEYKSYPRVGDWVRDGVRERVFQVKLIREDKAFGRIGAGVAIADLAPASPPVQEAAPSTDNVQPAKVDTLEGPHWDDIIGGKMLTMHEQQINKALRDLRGAVRKNEKRIAELEGKSE